jgi:hypothetical protein
MAAIATVTAYQLNGGNYEKAPAFAVDTTKTYSSGILVGIFLGFCALIVVVQLVPTIMLLVGFFKGLIKDHSKKTRRLASRI